MKRRSSLIVLLLTITCLSAVYGGTPSATDTLQERMRREDYFNRIDRKLESDIAATRVWKLAIETEIFPVQAIATQNAGTFNLGDPGTNELLFVVNEENTGSSRIFEVIPLAIRRTTAGAADAATGGLSRSSAQAEAVTAIMVHLKDIARLSIEDQQRINEYIVDNIAKAVPELDIKPESKPTSSVSPFNRDYWSFAKATSHHMVPFLENQNVRRLRRLGAAGGGASGPATVATPTSTIDMRDSVIKDSVEIRVRAMWPPFDGVAMYRLQISEGRDFANPIVQDSTSDTTLVVRGMLKPGTDYYARIQNANVASSPALKISLFRTKSASPTVAGGGASSDRLGYALDFSLSRITFAHELLYSESALGIPGFGVEVNFDNPILGLLPYKSPAMTWGGRLLLNTTGDKKDVLDRDFLELKLMARTRFDCQKFYDGMGALRYLFTPLASSDSPQLNVAAPGFAVEVATSRWWNLPYLNFYVSTGSDEYSDPVFSKGEGKDRYAYWSTSQWRGSMSFYFNLDSEPEFYLADALRKRLNIVRLDIGAGTYNVSRVGYDTIGNIASKVGVIKTSRIQPYLSVEFVHASQVKTSFGIRSAYFDNRVFLSAWLSLFKIGFHELRLEGTNILGPFGRAKYEWEASGGTMLQFRYRLGF
jgi:hypothetical protein